VTDTSRDFYSGAFQTLLSDPVPVFAKEINRAKPGHKKDPFTRNLDSNITRSGKKPPTILIGGKGYGKTTFLNWVLKVNTASIDLSKLIVVWVDFREIEFDPTIFDSALKRHVVKELSENPNLGIDSYSRIKEVFKKRLSREVKLSGLSCAESIEEFERDQIGKWREDAEEYLNALVSYSHDQCEKRILLILDNADQKDFIVQKKVFEFANQLSTRYNISIVACLRESSYFRICQTRTADAFSQQQVFHIQAPSLRRVLSQRFEHLSKAIKSKSIKFESASGAHIGVKDISNFIDLLQRSLLRARDSDDIQLFISAMSNGSIRHSFQMIHDFLLSGHSKMEDYFWKYAQNAKHSIPYHEFFASVLLDGMGYFSEKDSHMFLNVFSRSGNNGDSHFTRLRIMKVVEELSTTNSFKPDDFVKIDVVKSHFMKSGVSGTILEGHIKALIRFGLLMSDTQQDVDEETKLFDDDEEDDAISLHISACGKYYLDHIYMSFEYLSRIIPDTLICSEPVYTSLEKELSKYKDNYFLAPLQNRLKATEIFFDYLKECEEKELKDLALRGGLLSSISFMKTTESDFIKQLENIRDRDQANRMRGD
jgi:hypothetical protein